MSACSEKIHDYYAGIIIDEFGKPIENVSVKEDLVDKYAGKTTTDKNGFFKLKASTLQGLILKKDGYITDTVPMVWHQAGETTVYSPLRTADSSKYELKKSNSAELKFLHKEFKTKPQFFQITNPKFNTDSLFGIWMTDENNGFKITKEMLIGQRVEALLPRYVAKKHESFIKTFSQNSRHDLNQQWQTYARTVDGSLFQAEVRLKIYPYINRGLNLIAQVKKMQNPEIIMIVNDQGVIVDSSDELLPVLNLTKRDLDVYRMSDLCPGFKVID
ncbi:hypothetical protein EON78_03315, partial [bacterium]